MALNFQPHTKGVRVSPRSKASIRGLAAVFRLKIAQIDNDKPLNICDLIEFTLPRITKDKFEFITEVTHH